jgi:separase
MYDHQGLVRETEFYLTEALKLSQSLRRHTSPSYYQIALGDFYSRSGNLTKAKDLLSAAISDDALVENHMHKIQLETALSKYYQESSAEEQEYERYAAAESTLLAAIASPQKSSNSEVLEDMLSQLTITTAKKSKSKAKQIDEFFYINRIRATILRLKSRYLVCHEKWQEAEAVLQDSALLSTVQRDRALQDMAESHFHFIFATSLLQSDPVFTVLQDSAISIPNVSKTTGKSTKDSSSSATISGTQTRGRKIKSLTSPLSTTKKNLTDVQKILGRARQFVLESYFVASKICSAYEKQTISNHLGQVLLLQSAIGSMKDDAYCPAANYFFGLYR